MFSFQKIHSSTCRLCKRRSRSEFEKYLKLKRLNVQKSVFVFQIEHFFGNIHLLSDLCSNSVVSMAKMMQKIEQLQKEIIEIKGNVTGIKSNGPKNKMNEGSQLL